MKPEQIARINELARKQKSGELTADELREQAQLRREYVDAVKKNMKAQLDAIKIAPAHDEHCSCGCHHKH